ncbi:hypothetical protein ABC855_g2045 [[Candida] zeylanoides]
MLWTVVTYVPLQGLRAASATGGAAFNLLLLPVFKFVDVVYFALSLPFRPLVYALGLSADLGSMLPHARLLVSTLYYFVAVAAMCGASVGLATGLVLGLISYTLTPRPRAPQALLANAPVKQQPLNITNLKIDIKYDTPAGTPPGTPAAPAAATAPAPQQLPSPAPPSPQLLEASRASLDAHSRAELFSVRTEDTDLTHPTNEIKQYQRK